MSRDGNTDIEIKRKGRRRSIPFESEKLRERSACPKCNSILVKKRNRTNDYVCPVCGWVGGTVKKVMW